MTIPEPDFALGRVIARIVCIEHRGASLGKVQESEHGPMLGRQHTIRGRTGHVAESGGWTRLNSEHIKGVIGMWCDNGSHTADVPIDAVRLKVESYKTTGRVQILRI